MNKIKVNIIEIFFYFAYQLFVYLLTSLDRYTDTGRSRDRLSVTMVVVVLWLGGGGVAVVVVVVLLLTVTT